MSNYNISTTDEEDAILEAANTEGIQLDGFVKQIAAEKIAQLGDRVKGKKRDEFGRKVDALPVNDPKLDQALAVLDQI